jgi:putative hemolysin
MKKNARAFAVAVFFLMSSCSSEMAKRSAYESMQNKAQMDCQQHPGSACPEKNSYDDYQRSLNKRSEPRN